MRVLVLGSTGYIGSKVVEALNDRGFEVFEASRSSSELQLDLTDLDTFEDAPEVDVVVNAAGAGDLDGFDKDKLDWDRVNSEGLVNLSEKYGDTLLIHISSLSAMGLEGDYIKGRCEPRLPYSRSKAESEAVVRERFENYVIVRPGFVFGNSNPPPIPQLFSKIGLVPTNRRKTVAISRGKLARLIIYCLRETPDSPVLAGETFYPEELAQKTGLNGKVIYIPNTLIRIFGYLGEGARKLGLRSPGLVRSRSMVSEQVIENQALRDFES